MVNPDYLTWFQDYLSNFKTNKHHLQC